MKNTQFFLMFTMFLSLSCEDKSSISTTLDFNKEFTVIENLELKQFNEYDAISSFPNVMVDSSILWFFDLVNRNNIGCCFDLNTGKKLSTIGTIGNAKYEFTDAPYSSGIVEDSIQFLIHRRYIKTCLISDILENKPMGERQFSITPIPDSINTYVVIKLPNNSVISLFNSFRSSTNVNKKQVVVFNDSCATYYDLINYESPDIKEIIDFDSGLDKDLKSCYTNGSIIINGNDKAIVSVYGQFILNLLDLKSKKVIKETKFTDFMAASKVPGVIMSEPIQNEMKLRVVRMYSNEKYLFCIVDGYFSEEDKLNKKSQDVIFAFDWDLNPIKRYNLPDLKGLFYFISNDCKYVYEYSETENGFALSRAALNI